MPKLSIREITSKVPIHTSPPYIQLFLIRDCPIQEKDEEGAFKRYIALIKKRATQQVKICSRNNHIPWNRKYIFIGTTII